MKKKGYYISLLICMLVLFSGLIVFASGERIVVQYVKTSDGDTARFILNGENVRVRFLGINTPEVSGENKVEEPYGKEALQYTETILENAKKIEIEFDNIADEEDRFGRKLAWVWVDDELLEVKILQEGLAKTYMLKNNYRYAKELKEAESIAKKQRLGLWSSMKQKEEKSNINLQSKNIEISETNSYESKEEDKSILIYVTIFVLLVIVIAILKNKNAK